MGNKKCDIICAGEILADLVAQKYSEEFGEFHQFQIYPGGAAANLAMNLAHLGNKVGLIASVGQDDIGKMLTKKIRSSGVSTEFLAKREKPSTLVLVSRNKGIANFEAYRGADAEMTLGQVDVKKIAKAKIFHTTCFGLSKEPARSTILACAQIVAEHEGQLSIDINYAKKIWPKRKKAINRIQEYLEYAPLVKCSNVDYERIYGRAVKNPQRALDKFLEMGAKQICLTLGTEGCWVADAQNESFIPSRKIDVVDNTGAGDAFWAGYLTAYLQNENIVNCAKAGRAMAEMKLKTVGPIEEKVTLATLLG